jgi:hypothetical protein
MRGLKVMYFIYSGMLRLLDKYLDTIFLVTFYMPVYLKAFSYCIHTILHDFAVINEFTMTIMSADLKGVEKKFLLFSHISVIQLCKCTGGRAT